LNGVRGDDDDEPAGPDRDAAFGEEFTQLFNCSADPFSGGVLACAERSANFPQRFAFKIAQQDGRLVGGVERVHGFIEKRFNMRPVGISGIHGLEFAGDTFADLPARFAANNIDGRAANNLIQPGRKNRVRRQTICLTGEVDEHGLGYFLRQLWRTDLAERGGKDEIEVATDNFGEGIFRIVPGVSRKQLQIGVAHVHKYIVAAAKTGQKRLGNGALPAAHAISKKWCCAGWTHGVMDYWTSPSLFELSPDLLVNSCAPPFSSLRYLSPKTGRDYVLLDRLNGLMMANNAKQKVVLYYFSFGL
jgi:hypothetical protein